LRGRARESDHILKKRKNFKLVGKFIVCLTLPKHARIGCKKGIVGDILWCGRFKSYRSHQYIYRSHLDVVGFPEESDTIHLCDILARAFTLQINMKKQELNLKAQRARMALRQGYGISKEDSSRSLLVKIVFHQFNHHKVKQQYAKDE
jgi:hypothetical protein